MQSEKPQTFCAVLCKACQELPVHFTSSSEEVIVGSSMMILHKRVEDRRGTNPDPAIAYRIETDTPDISPPGSFTLERKRMVFATFEGTPLTTEGGAEPEVRQDSLAASLPLGAWQASAVCKPVQTMRWAQQGLMPVRPQIVLMEQVELPPNSTLKC